MLLDGLPVGLQAGDMLLNRLADVALRLFNRGAVAEASRKRRAVSKVSGGVRSFMRREAGGRTRVHR